MYWPAASSNPYATSPPAVRSWRSQRRSAAGASSAPPIVECPALHVCVLLCSHLDSSCTRRLPVLRENDAAAQWRPKPLAPTILIQDVVHGPGLHAPEQICVRPIRRPRGNAEGDSSSDTSALLQSAASPFRVHVCRDRIPTQLDPRTTVVCTPPEMLTTC